MSSSAGPKRTCGGGRWVAGGQDQDWRWLIGGRGWPPVRGATCELHDDGGESIANLDLGGILAVSIHLGATVIPQGGQDSQNSDHNNPPPFRKCRSQSCKQLRNHCFETSRTQVSGHYDPPREGGRSRTYHAQVTKVPDKDTMRRCHLTSPGIIPGHHL